MKVKEINMTCMACPSQWEGFLEDGRMFYARYRWGYLTLNLSLAPTEDVSVAIHGNRLISKSIGDPYEGIMTTEELQVIMQDSGFEF